jgi:SAM-dependent methyltransferase
LAYRDLPEIIGAHLNDNKAMDFGCGTGRSTRFLQKLGFDVIGVDIAEEMIRKAREINPEGSYLLVEDGKLDRLEKRGFDLVLSVFTFDNIPTMEKKVTIFKDIRGLLNNDGKIISVVSSPEIYTHEWASFSTKDFPENKSAKCGDKVKIIITAIDDKRPVEDIVWPDEDYRDVYRSAGLDVVEMRKPLAKGGEPYDWVNETRIAPWAIYVLKMA